MGPKRCGQLLLVAAAWPTFGVDRFETDEVKTVSVADGPLHFETTKLPFVFGTSPDEHEVRMSISEKSARGAEIEDGQEIDSVPDLADRRTVFNAAAVNMFA